MRDSFTTDEWKRVEEVFAAVVDEPPERCAVILAELGPGEERVRREVQSLLRFDGEATHSSSAPECAGTSRRIGQVVGRWRLLFPISLSTASEVWCAEASVDPSPTSSRVALKLLREQTDRRLARFENEARLLQRFRHPNIAEFVECGVADGTAFIATQFVDGKQLTAFADERQLTLSERAGLMIRICDAVGYAHRFLVVHRDLKPSNIVVTEGGQPVILDFGISKVVEDSETQNEKRADLTNTQERPMTPAYASPEQARGDAITTSTDVYALGLILYELATGHHPYSASAHPDAEHLFDRICRSHPRRASAVVASSATPFGSEHTATNGPRLIAALRSVTPRLLQRQLRRGLDSVIEKAMSKTPEDRYASVADLRQDLVSFVESRPVSARPRESRLLRLVDRRPLFTLAITFLAASVLSGAAISWIWHRSNDRLRTEATAALRSAQTAQQEAAAARASFATLESHVLSETQSANSDSSGSARLVASPRAIARLMYRAANEGRVQRARLLLDSLPEVPSLDVDASLDVADTCRCLGFPIRGLLVLTAQLERKIPAASGLAERLGLPTKLGIVGPEQFRLRQFTAEPQKIVQFQTLMIELLNLAQRWEEAQRWSQEQFAGIEDSYHHPRYVLATAEMRLEIGWPEGAVELLAPLDAAPTEYSLSAADLRRLDGLLAIAEGEPKNVESKLRALSRVSHSGETHLAMMACKMQLEAGRLALAAGQLDRAEKDFLQILNDLRERHLGEHILAQQAMMELCSVSYERGDTESTRVWAERVWRIAVAHGELGSSAITDAATTLMHNGHSRTSVLQTLAPFAAALERNPYQHRFVLACEAETEIEASEWLRALPILEQLVPMEKRLWNSNSVEYGRQLATLAFVQRQVGNSVEADKNLAEAAQIASRLLLRPDGMLAKAFLAAIGYNKPAVDGNLSDYEWFRYYELHRFNDADTQAGMLWFAASNLPAESPQLAALLPAVLDLLEEFEAEQSDVEANFHAFAQLAVEKRVIDSIRAHLEQRIAAQPTNARFPRLLIEGFARDGDYNAAVEVLSEYKATFGVSELRELRTMLVERLPDSLHSQLELILSDGR